MYLAALNFSMDQKFGAFCFPIYFNSYQENSWFDICASYYELFFLRDAYFILCVMFIPGKATQLS